MYKIIGEYGTCWYYDANTNTIYDFAKNPINLKHLTSGAQFFSVPLAPNKKLENHIGLNCALKKEDKYFSFDPEMTDLVIQLGQSCNYKCVYCNQNACPKDVPTKSDIKGFLSRLKSSPLPWDNIHYIQLWGGEPLIYWKALKQIVEFVHKEIPQFKGYFHITTNGSLLTREIADFILEHKIRMQVSHDGVNQKQQRNKDWLDDPVVTDLVIELLGKHKLGEVNMTFGPLFNPNLLASLAFFKKKLPGVEVCCRGSLRCDSTNQHLMNLFSKENIQIAKESYYKVLTLKEGDEFYDETRTVRAKLFMFCKNFIEGTPPSSIQFNCPTLQRQEMSFNLRGNYIPCHGSSEIMKKSSGTIDDPKSCYFTGFTSVSNRKMCKGCLYTQICQGPCGMYGDVDASIHCRSTKWAWEAWFLAIWKTLFNEKPVNIEEVNEVF